MSVRTRKNGVVALQEENEPCNFSDEVEIKEEHKKQEKLKTGLNLGLIDMILRATIERLWLGSD